MGTRADYVAALATEMVNAGEVVPIYDRPLSPVPSVPCVMLTPGAPYLEAAGPRTYVVRLEAILWVGALDSETVMGHLDLLLPIVRYAAPEAELRYLETRVGVQNSAGVDYVTARSILEGETTSP